MSRLDKARSTTKTRKSFTLETKLLCVLEIVERGRSDNDIAQEQGTDVRVVRRWIKEQKTMVEQLLSGTFGFEVRKRQPVHFPELEMEIVRFMEQVRARFPTMKLPFTYRLLQTRAQQIYESLSPEVKAKYPPFVQSNGWAARLMARHSWTSVKLHGEAGELDLTVGHLADAISSLRTKISNYPLVNVFNVDETGLNFRQYPSTSIVSEVMEDADSARGNKQMTSKERITLVVCTNATGTVKVPVLVIGKAKQPVALRKKRLPANICCTSQENAWTDREISQNWLQETFVPAVLSAGLTRDDRRVSY
jgi:hypothetical protein